jgi:hypothetical protein
VINSVPRGLQASPVPQAETCQTSVRKIMACAEFARGVADVRAGRPPRFDAENSWEYERGRQWAVAAPKTMPVKIGRRINPRAFAVFVTAVIP